MIGRLEGDGPRLLLIGHMDTVFEAGTVAERPFRVEGDRAFGPGVTDMKAGLLAGFHAIRALQSAGARPSVTYVCNPDEEIGSPFSSPHIRALVPQHDAAFVLECARANGDIVSARKGVAALLKRQGAPGPLVEIAARLKPLEPAPPPGTNEIVTAREAQTPAASRTRKA